MKKLVAVAFVLMAMAPLRAQQDRSLLTLDELIGDWKISREFTIAVAEKMPAEYWSFKPNPQQFSFGEQMTHIAGAQAFRFAQLTDGKPPFPFPKETLDKPATIKLLNASFDYVIGLLPKITPGQMAKMFKVDWKGRPEVNGRQMMMNMLVHTAHHRAQCEVYLRIKGIQPPDYTF